MIDIDIVDVAAADVDSESGGDLADQCSAGIAFRQGVVPVVRVYVERGQRWIIAGPCPFCGGEHRHTWPATDHTPGRRVGPCTARIPGEYFLQASPELLERETAHRRRRRERRATAGQKQAGGTR